VKRKKKKNNSNSRILLIVENSEVIFFKEYFNSYLKNEYGVSVKCEPSGNSNKCNITNFDKMSKRVKEALERESFKAVFVMIDLDTKCLQRDRNHKCLVELKKEYLPKYYKHISSSLRDKFYLFVVCNEIESWFLTAYKESGNTNNPNEDHKVEIKKRLGRESEIQIVQKVVSDLKRGKIELDFSKNSSLQFFINKLQEYRS